MLKEKAVERRFREISRLVRSGGLAPHCALATCPNAVRPDVARLTAVEQVRYGRARRARGKREECH